MRIIIQAKYMEYIVSSKDLLCVPAACVEEQASKCEVVVAVFFSGSNRWLASFFFFAQQ